MSDSDTYMIVRFHQNASKEIIKRGLTLEEAKEHCQNESTSGNGWFDGFEKEW